MSRISSVEQVDVVIVGAGAAGGVIADRAVAAGKQVLLLEAGPARGMSDLVSSQIWARKLKWSGPVVEEQGDEKVGHSFNSGWGTGGSAMHHYAVWPRLHAGDFDVASRHGVGLDWPLAYEELRPYYDKAQSDVGISGDAAREVWRPPGDKYPMPPLPVFAQGNVIGKGFEAMGLATSPIPLAVNSIEYKGRASCLYDGWCDAGCPIGALANPLATYLGWALAAGAQIKNRAWVTRVLHDKSGSRATGVEYADETGERHQVMADTVVLAAFTVQTSRLLLASSSSAHPNGLSNRNDLVGRYLMTHPAVSVYGMFEDETQPHLGATGGQLLCQENYDDKKSDDGGYGSYQWLIANAVKPNDLLGISTTRPDIYGAALDPFMKKAAKHFGNMVCIGEGIASANNRVTLSSNKDAYGEPLASTVHNVAKSSAIMREGALAQGKAVFKAGGANEVWSGPPGSIHIMGGTVMGKSAADSVTDEFGRCHELENLYIAGPGLFPSSGAVNPTFTLHALALRTAEHLFTS
ncbi:MAG: GMC family oxidoreductase [Halioglobus sp.]